MQLLIILALLLYGGGNTKNVLGEIKPVLESIGGEEMQKAIKSAEQIQEVLSAVQSFSNNNSPKSVDLPKSDNEFPLAPISAIADREITYSLNKYIQTS